LSQAATSPSQAFAGGDANDVTTQRLVEFADIVELQQQNARLLVVNRQLGAAAEATRSEAEEALRREYEAQVHRLSQELAALREGRRSAEELLQQVVQQRDTLRHLLHGGDLGAARAAYSQSIGGEGQQQGQQAQQEQAQQHGQQAQQQQQGQADHRAMHADLEQQFKEYKAEATKNQQMLAEDVGSRVSSRHRCRLVCVRLFIGHLLLPPLLLLHAWECAVLFLPFAINAHFILFAPPSCPACGRKPPPPAVRLPVWAQRPNSSGTEAPACRTRSSPSGSSWKA
jgi:hypothetical protein